MKAAHAHAAAVRAADGPEWREAVRLGESGTTAHAAGAHSFQILSAPAQRHKRVFRKSNRKKFLRRKQMG